LFGNPEQLKAERQEEKEMTQIRNLKFPIFDRHIPVHSTEKYALTDELLNELDRMLTAENIAHMFTLPTPQQAQNNERPDQDDQIELNLFYESELDFEVVLIYGYWLKKYRKLETNIAIKNVVRSLSEDIK
jgi:hypothetical protein